VSASWPPPPPTQPGPRRRFDARWATVVVVGIIIVVVLVRQKRIHISTFDLLYFAAVVPSVILHEVTHGWVALIFGDDTAKRAGRLSLNPLVHISVFGTIIVPALLVLAGYPAFGWAKPVPVNISRLRRPRNQSVVVSLAGPLTNIILAVVFGLIFGVIVSQGTKFNVYALDYYQNTGFKAPIGDQYLFYLAYVNVILAVFNLIPIPPLDGSSVLERLMPRSWIPGYLSIRPYTIFLPFLLLYIHPQWFEDVFQPFVNLLGHITGNGYQGIYYLNI
jgi:Zn-dependent protease